MNYMSFLLAGIGLFLLCNCAESPAKEVTNNSSIQKASAPKATTVARDSQKVEAQNLPPIPAKATDLFAPQEVADLFSLNVPPSTRAVPISDPQSRAVQYLWNNDVDGLVFIIQGFNPAVNQAGRYKRTLDYLLQEGEPKNPDPKNPGKIEYIAKDGVGDQAIWSAEERILKWRIGESYFGTLMRQPANSTTEKEDRITLQQMAVTISARLRKLQQEKNGVR